MDCALITTNSNSDLRETIQHLHSKIKEEATIGSKGYNEIAINSVRCDDVVRCPQ